MNRRMIIHPKIYIQEKGVFSHRMQHLYSNDNNNSLPQHDTDMYTQSTHLHQHLMHHHVQYPPISPQQSSTSDADETSTPSPAILNKGINVTVATKIVKKKKQPKKKRKDPNEPQKPVSPYALFFRDTQNDIKKKLANPSFGEISKVVAHMWENIEPEVKEQYKRKAAAAKKEYLKQLAAYRAVQVSHQTPTMHHILNQNPLPFEHPNSLQQKSYTHPNSMITDNNTYLSSTTTHPHHPHHPHPHQHYHHHHPVQQYAPPSIPQQQYPNYHYMNNYSQDTANVYTSDIHFPTHHFDHSQTTNYSSYDSNNNYGDHQQQYGLLRPAIESELYSSYYSTDQTTNSTTTINENLLHNLNNNTTSNTPHYTDLTSISNANHHSTKSYDYLSNTNDQKDDEHSNENNFHWNQATCLATQW